MKILYDKDIGHYIPHGNGYIAITRYVFRNDNTAFVWQRPVALIEHKKEEV